ncbi:MAG: iron ABC transporter permease [bacterium]
MKLCIEFIYYGDYFYDYYHFSKSPSMNAVSPSPPPSDVSAATFNLTRYLFWITGLLVLLVVAGFFSLSLGSTHIPFPALLKAFRAWLLSGGTEGVTSTIIFRIRLPRLVLGLSVGGALSVAGVIFQGMFHNPLVEPYTLGISGGAALGVCLFVVRGWQFFRGISLLPLAGFFGALVTLAIVYGISVKKSLLQTNTMLLAGVMISFISSSAIMLLMALSQSLQELHSLLFWTMGSLEENNSRLVILISFSILLLVGVSFLFYRELNTLVLGEEEALHLGVSVHRVKKWLFLLGTLLTALAVSISGMIGFVGLIVPHLMRMLSGSDHRLLIISSFLSGGIFLILADTLARTLIAPVELPVGVITGLAGGSLFIYFLYKKNIILG